MVFAQFIPKWCDDKQTTTNTLLKVLLILALFEEAITRGVGEVAGVKENCKSQCEIEKNCPTT